MLLSHICRKLNYKKWNFYLHGCIKYNKLKMTFNIVKMFYLMLIMSEQILLKKNLEKVTKSRDFLNVCDLGYNFYQAIINMYIVVHFENIKCFVCAHIHVTIPFTIHFSVTDLENSDRWKKNMAIGWSERMFFRLKIFFCTPFLFGICLQRVFF